MLLKGIPPETLREPGATPRSAWASSTQSLVRLGKLGARAISEKISNSIWAPTIAVLVVGSYCGATSTTSPPMMSMPLRPCRIACASRGVRPPASGVPVPGAKAGSSPSTSNEI